MQNRDNVNFFIIADDFTGANDTGVQLAKKGAYVDVYFDWMGNCTQSSSDVVVVNTDSRALSIEQSQSRIKQLIHANQSIERPIYKKIDSTLRGNIGAEITTLLAATDYDIALIVPAFPDMYRTVKNGICYVNGVELSKTEFASDPKTPIYSSQIKQCLALQTDLLCEEINLDLLRNQKLATTINNQANKGSKLFIVDAENNHDLQQIVEQLSHINYKLLLVGSSGLMNFLPVKYAQKSTVNKHNNDELMLVIAGSMSQTTQKQIEHATQSADKWQVVDIDINDLLPDFSDDKLQHYGQLIQNTLAQHKNCIVRTCKDESERHHIEEYCQQYHLSRQALGEYICLCLGKIVQHTPIHNLFLTGGDVAIAIAKSLGASGFHIEGEVTAGVPYGTLIGNTNLNYRIFTKAGGFGEQNIFTKSLELI